MSGISSVGERALPVTIPRVSLGLAAILAAGLLVYVSGSFMFAEVFGIKRPLQVLLVALLLAGALAYGLRMRWRDVNALMIFVVVMIATEIIVRGKLLYVFDGISSLLALIVIYAVPTATFWRGAKFVAWMAVTFAVMACIQFVILIFNPELGDFRLLINDDNVILNSVKHPIMFLGLFGELQYTLFGKPVGRMQSFALEPSLNVVYFLLPAAMAMLFNRKSYFIIGGLILLFCVLSLSGSVFLACAFMLIWTLLLPILSIRFAFSYGLLLVLAGYLYAMQRVGLEVMVAGLTMLKDYGDFMGKSTSLTVRGLAASENLSAALASPLGSSNISDMAGPWVVNGALVAGWLGAALIIVFLRGFAGELQRVNVGYGLLTRTRLGTLMLLGVMSTIVAFNDYQMSNYAGIVLLAFVHRTVVSRLAAEQRKYSRTQS